MPIEHPFHSGELQVQERLGETGLGARNGRAISDSILPGAFRFIEAQPLVVLGSVARGGRVSCSLLFGEPGFLSVPDARRLELDLDRAFLDAEDPLLDDLEGDPRVGALFIEPASRRRLRVNGTAVREGARLRLDVTESYPNCPKYIRRRMPIGRPERATSGARAATRAGDVPGPDELALVEAADTFFVASAHPRGGLDVSHRGGPAGFVEVQGGATLRVPDYAGNHMYNTLGNVLVNPAAGLAFHDFDTGRTLALNGRAALEFDAEDPRGVTGGTGRFWTFAVEHYRSFESPARLAWETLEASPHNPAPKRT